MESRKRKLLSDITNNTASTLRELSAASSNCCLGSKEATWDGRQTIEKSKKGRDAAILTVSAIHFNKKKDKEEAIAEPFSSSPPETMKDNQNGICNHYGLLERRQQKDKENLSAFTNGPVEIAKESSKQILNSYSCSYETIEKGKGILNSRGCSRRKQKEIGKGISNPSSCSNGTNDEEKGSLMISGSRITEKKEKGKELINPPSSIIEITKEKRKELVNPSCSLNERTKEEGKPLSPVSS